MQLGHSDSKPGEYIGGRHNRQGRCYFLHPFIVSSYYCESVAGDGYLKRTKDKEIELMTLCEDETMMREQPHTHIRTLTDNN